MFAWLRPDVELATDLSPAEWFSSTLEPWARDEIRLASFMPDGFDCYTRILHPFELKDGRTTTYRRWSDVAAERGIRINAETRAEQVAGDEWEALGGDHPVEGELPEAVCASLVGILGRETQTPARCCFALWSGWGSLRSASIPLSDPGPSRKDIREFHKAQRRKEAALETIPQIAGVHASTGRRYFLFGGPVDAACSFESNSGHHRHLPSFWWPDDRSWAVVTEIDGMSTYVGGSRTAIDEILATEDLEAIEVDRGVRLA